MGKSAETAQTEAVASGLGVTEKQGSGWERRGEQGWVLYVGMLRLTVEPSDEGMEWSAMVAAPNGTHLLGFFDTLQDAMAFCDSGATELLSAVVLGPDHDGMRIDASGVLCNNNKGSTQFRKMMLGHLQDLAQRYYAGDTGAVDDFLQTYCLGVDARKLAKERQGVAAAEGGR